MPSIHDGLVVRFILEPTQHSLKSKEAGRPIFEDVEICEIRFPGDRSKTGKFPAHEIEPNATRLAGKGPYSQFNEGEKVTYAMLYNEQYRAFKNGMDQPTSGTPLSELPFLTQAKRLELRALNILTAEQLAGLDGNPLKQLGMGGRALKDQAQAYIDKARGSADVTGLAASNAALSAQVEELKQQMAEVLANAKPAKPLKAVSESAFGDWEAEDLKNWITEQTGARPKGNPSLSTLIATADEINAQLKAKAAEKVAA